MRIPRRLFGLDLDETIAGGAEPERIAGRGGADLITGGEGDDALRGNRGDDTLVGGEGDDTLAGGGGSDLLVGGAGRDLFRFVANGGGRDTVEGYSATEDALRFDGYDDVIVRVMSDTEAWITFGAGLAGEAVLLRAAPGGPAGAFALGDLAVSNDLRIEIAAGVNLLVPEGETFSAAGDLVIVFEGDAPVTPAGGGLGVNASGTPGGGAVTTGTVTTGTGSVVLTAGGVLTVSGGIIAPAISRRVTDDSDIPAWDAPGAENVRAASLAPPIDIDGLGRTLLAPAGGSDFGEARLVPSGTIRATTASTVAAPDMVLATFDPPDFGSTAPDEAPLL